MVISIYTVKSFLPRLIKIRGRQKSTTKKTKGDNMKNRIISILLVVIFGLSLGLSAMASKPVEVVNVTEVETEKEEAEEVNYIEKSEELEKEAKKFAKEAKKKAEAAKKPVMKSLGRYKLTAYCPCSKCCGKSNGITASGTKATQGRTVACNSLAIGTKININGHDYIVEDRGTSHIDVFFNSHKAALNFGVQYAEVFVYE